MSNYSSLLKKILAKYSSEEITQICKTLNKMYNIYDSEEYRWSQIKYVFSKTSETDLTNLRKLQLSNQVINDLIINYYPCERVVKYEFIKKLLAFSDNIVAFEMSIGKSRIDICRINGHSYAYEIKTQYDTFERLSSQMSDYIDTFERVYLVIPSELRDEAALHIPDECGIITYRYTNTRKFCTHYYRKAAHNICSIQKCAESLSSADLSSILKLTGFSEIPKSKCDKLQKVVNIPRATFEKAYKKILFDKYSTKWEYLVSHFNEILPIDIQNFFSTTISPDLVYYNKRTE